MTIKQTLILLLSFVLIPITASHAATCPPIESITRINGEYKWVTSVPGWTGYFVAPTTGKGRSYTVKNFINTSWVKSHDTVDSTGFIQCDYGGDFVSIVKLPNPNYDPASARSARSNPEPKFKEVVMSEVIRFVQSNANGAYMPSTAKNIWTCNSIVKFPSEACICHGNLKKCKFRIG